MFTSELLASGHVVGGFACGNEELDGWLKSAAYTAQRAGTSRTYVWAGDSSEVLAYFAVAPTSIALADTPSSFARGAPDPLPGYLLAKLARDLQLRGGGHGEALLLTRSTSSSAQPMSPVGAWLSSTRSMNPPPSSTSGTGFVAPIPAVTALCSR